ncbi:MAG: OmpH family outer membrane protein [Elusimicrobia bacterium]|nr:OmpH family outer membrane protein [Elusimicrobiota bacterium]
MEHGSGRNGGAVGYVDMEDVFREFPETQKAKSEYYVELAKRKKELADWEKELADLREQLTVLRTTLSEADAMPQVSTAASPVPPVGMPVLSGSTVTAPATSTATAFAPIVPNTAPATSDFSRSPTGLSPETFPAGAVGPGFGPGAADAVRASLVERERILVEKEAALNKAKQEAVQALRNMEEKRSMQIYGKLYHAITQIAEEEGVSLVVDKSSIIYGQSAIDLTERLRRRIRGLPDVEPEDD